MCKLYNMKISNLNITMAPMSKGQGFENVKTLELYIIIIILYIVLL